MTSLRHTVNLGNSIIGVSILAMPYCFKKCGIILAILLIISSSLINRAGCHLLLRSAIMARRRNFSVLTYTTFGPPGKLLVELGTLGFLLGTCVAFFVVIGDLGPSLVSSLFNLTNGPHLRAFTMTFLGMFVALPLGLLRRVESLTSFSALSLGLYLFLIVKLFFDALSTLSADETFSLSTDLTWWDSSGILTTLPIFAMALACQTQLFEIFDSSLMLSDDYNNSIRKMNKSIKGAINLCALFYITVGIFGYIAFHDKPIRGNVLLFLPPSFISALTKLIFIFTVIVSLPLCLFPCRTSLHSLIFKKTTGSLLNDISSTPSIYMTDAHFRLLTIILIVTTISVSVLLPHIEVILGIVGSTIGTVICFVLPAMIFMQLTVTNTTERIMAHVVSYIGIFILIACSYSTIQDATSIRDDIVRDNIIKAYSTKTAVNHMMDDKLPKFDEAAIKLKIASSDSNVIPNPPEIKQGIGVKQPELGKSLTQKVEESLQKPRVLPPKEPDRKKIDNNRQQEKTLGQISPPQQQQQQLPKVDVSSKIQKEEEILRRLEKQQQEHKKLLEEQKEILKEIKEHDQSHHNNGQVADVKRNPENISGIEVKAKIGSSQKPVMSRLSSRLPEKNSFSSPMSILQENKAAPVDQKLISPKPQLGIIETNLSSKLESKLPKERPKGLKVKKNQTT